MKTIKNLIALSLFVGVLFSTNSTFTGRGSGAAIGLGVGLGTAAIVGSSVAASRAADRDRAYLAARDREYYYRDAEARRREAEAQRRHELELARIQAGQGQYPVQNRYPVRTYPVRNQYPTNEDYYGGATTISVEE